MWWWWGGAAGFRCGWRPFRWIDTEKGRFRARNDDDWSQSHTMTHTEITKWILVREREDGIWWSLLSQTETIPPVSSQWRAPTFEINLIPNTTQMNANICLREFCFIFFFFFVVDRGQSIWSQMAFCPVHYCAGLCTIRNWFIHYGYGIYRISEFELQTSNHTFRTRHWRARTRYPLSRCGKINI